MLASWILEHGQLKSLVTADVRGWIMLTYTVVVSGIVGFGLWFWLIARCSIGRVGPFNLLQPVFAAASSVLFLGERLTAPLVVGGLIGLVGVAVIQLKPKASPGASRTLASAAADHLACSAHPPASEREYLCASNSNAEASSSRGHGSLRRKRDGHIRNY
jgi:hypothetical protein